MQAYEKVSPQINSAIDRAVPVLKQGVDEVAKVAGPAFSKAVPVVQVQMPLHCLPAAWLPLC
jgi:hypothetical protein